jgi:hypothetical protein
MTDYAQILQVALTSKNPKGEMLKIETALEEELKKVLDFIAQRSTFILFLEISPCSEMPHSCIDAVELSAEMTIC